MLSPNVLILGFRPLTGMVRRYCYPIAQSLGFSPPYGDGTFCREWNATVDRFSPPYGDKSKSALQGLDRQQMTFPSPCEEKLKFGTRTLMAWQRSFRPLTGMVQIWNELFRDQNLFSPPYGDGTIRPLLNTLQRVFSPPYGDSTQGANISIWINGFPSPCGAAPLYHGGGTIEIPFQGEP